MAQPRSTAAIRRRARTRVAALSLALAVLGAARWASAGALAVSDAPLDGLEFFDVASCDVSGREVC